MRAGCSVLRPRGEGRIGRCTARSVVDVWSASYGAASRRARREADPSFRQAQPVLVSCTGCALPSEGAVGSNCSSCPCPRGRHPAVVGVSGSPRNQASSARRRPEGTPDAAGGALPSTGTPGAGACRSSRSRSRRRRVVVAAQLRMAYPPCGGELHGGRGEPSAAGREGRLPRSSGSGSEDDPAASPP